MKSIKQHLFHPKIRQIARYYSHFWLKNALFFAFLKSYQANAVASYFGLSLLFLSSISVATDNQFVNFFTQLESLSANFTQKTYSENNTLIGVTSGQLVFNRPRQLKWYTNTPNEQILLLNDNQLWLIDIELEQASLQSIQDLSQSPLYWLLNKPSLDVDVPKFSHQYDGVSWYQTHDNSSKAQQLNFGFENQILKAISLKNALEQSVVIVFTDVVINPRINLQVFKPNLEPGFDIIQ